MQLSLSLTLKTINISPSRNDLWKLMTSNLQAIWLCLPIWLRKSRPVSWSVLNLPFLKVNKSRTQCQQVWQPRNSLTFFCLVIITVKISRYAWKWITYECPSLTLSPVRYVCILGQAVFLTTFWGARCSNLLPVRWVFKPKPLSFSRNLLSFFPSLEFFCLLEYSLFTLYWIMKISAKNGSLPACWVIFGTG